MLVFIPTRVCVCFWNSDLAQYSSRCLWLAEVLILLQGYVTQPYTRSFMASLQRFVPATCPMKFNKLNSVRHVAGTKYPPNWCCTVIKVSVYTREHVAATYPWDMYLQHFHVPVQMLWFCPRYTSLLHVASECTAQVFCRCSMSLRHVPATSLLSAHL